MSFVRYSLLWLLLFSGFIPSLLAQEAPLSLWLEEAAEEWSGEEAEGHDAEWEALSYLREHPIPLNTATWTQLKQLPFLSDYQIDALLEYVGEHGPMQTLGELQLVRGMDWSTIRTLRPYVTVGEPSPHPSRPSGRGKQELEARLDLPFYTRRGYEKWFWGPKLYQSLRGRFSPTSQLLIGVAAEKDAGEPWGAEYNRWGYDHYAAFVQGQGRGVVEQWTVGCYRASFGEGLVMGNSFLSGKSFSLTTATYQPQGIRPFASNDEVHYLQGGAVTLRPAPGWQLTALASYRRLDAIVEEGAITSILQTGLHRTTTEADRKDTAAMYVGGIHLGRRTLHTHWGVTAIGYGFDRPYQPSRSGYAFYRLHGRRFYNVGADYGFRYKGLTWSGEVARGTRGWGIVNKLNYQLAGRARLLLLHRYYSHDYWAYFAQSFAEGSSPQNEDGWYLAAELPLSSRWQLFASADWFHFPWWRYGISAPSRGIDLRTQATYRPADSPATFSLSYRYKQGKRDVAGTKGQEITPVRHHRLRARGQWQSGGWTLRTTADYNHYHHLQLPTTQGYQLTQLFSYASPRRTWSVACQGTWFHTDNYYSRVFVSEPGLLHTFYQPSFSGHGLRGTLRLSAQPFSFLTLLLKLGHTRYFDRNSIGSGYDLIEGSRKTDLQMQARLRF